MAAPIVSTQFLRLLDKRLREVLEMPYPQIASMIPTLFGEKPSDSAWDEFYSVGSLPDIPQFNGKLDFQNPSPGYIFRVESKEFAGGLIFEKKFLDDKKYNVLDDRQGSLSRALWNSKEKKAAEAFGYAASTGWRFMYSEEGLSLCNTAHTTKSGVSTSSGFSNLGTAAASRTALAASWIAARRFRDDIGNLFGSNFDTIICPDTLGDTFEEIIGSRNDPDAAVATNRMNQQNRSRWSIIRYQLLDDYSTKNWYIVDRTMMKKFLLWINRVDKETATWYDNNTFSTMQSVYSRFGWLFRDWRFIYMNQVS